MSAPAQVHFTWLDVPVASGHVQDRDNAKAGSYATTEATAGSGAAGTTVSAGLDALELLRVAGERSGIAGPK